MQLHDRSTQRVPMQYGQPDQQRAKFIRPNAEQNQMFQNYLQQQQQKASGQANQRKRTFDQSGPSGPSTKMPKAQYPPRGTGQRLTGATSVQDTIQDDEEESDQVSFERFAAAGVMNDMEDLGDQEYNSDIYMNSNHYDPQWED